MGKKVVFVLFILISFLSCSGKSTTTETEKYTIKKDDNVSQEKVNNVAIDTSVKYSPSDSEANSYFLQIKDLFNNLNKNSLAKEDLEKLLKDYLPNDNKTSKLVNNICSTDNSQEVGTDNNTLIELFKIVLEERKQVSNEQKKTIEYYIDSVNNSKNYFEYFVYFVGVVLIFIGVMIFLTVRALGIWQNDKINHREKEFDDLKKNLNEYLDKLKNKGIESSKIQKIFEDKIEGIDKKSTNFDEKFSNIESLENDLLDLIERMKDFDKTQKVEPEEETQKVESEDSGVKKSPNPFK